MSDKLDERIVRIIRGLWIRTVERQEIEWERRTRRARSEAFDFSTPDTTISIIKDDEGMVTLQFLDDTGTVIEEVSSWDLNLPKGMPEALDQIYGAARRRALQVDERLDRLNNLFGADGDK